MWSLDNKNKTVQCSLVHWIKSIFYSVVRKLDLYQSMIYKCHRHRNTAYPWHSEKIYKIFSHLLPNSDNPNDIHVFWPRLNPSTIRVANQAVRNSGRCGDPSVMTSWSSDWITNIIRITTLIQDSLKRRFADVKMLPFNRIMSVIIAVIMARVVYGDFGCRGVSVILHLVLLLCQHIIFAAPSEKPLLSIEVR